MLNTICLVAYKTNDIGTSLFDQQKGIFIRKKHQRGFDSTVKENISFKNFSFPNNNLNQKMRLYRVLFCNTHNTLLVLQYLRFW